MRAILAKQMRPESSGQPWIVGMPRTALTVAPTLAKRAFVLGR
jgi:hypothetical protein